MPRPGMLLETGKTESQDLDEAVALSLAAAEADVWASSPPPAPPQSGVSFAHMAKMGFAASGESPPPLATDSSGVLLHCYFGLLLFALRSSTEEVELTTRTRTSCKPVAFSVVFKGFLGSCSDAAKGSCPALPSAGL